MNIRAFVTVSVLVLAAAIVSCQGGGSKAAEEALFTKIGEHVLPASRMVELSCVVTVSEIPEGAKELRLWVPYPSGPASQHAFEPTTVYPSDYRPVVHYTRYGAPYLFVSGERPLPAEFKVEYTLKVKRDEVRAEGAGPVNDQSPLADDLAPLAVSGLDVAESWLGPMLLPVQQARLRQIAIGLEVTDNSVAARAVSIVRYVEQTLEYDPSARNAGRTRRVLASGRGDCADYALVAVALMRAAGIPARVESGYLLSEHRRPERTPLADEASWVIFWDGRCWLCADPCLADRYPELAEYMLGGLCANRVQLSVGPEIDLDPRPVGAQPRPFVRAFAEADDRPVPVETRFFFRDTGAVGNWGIEP